MYYPLLDNNHNNCIYNCLHLFDKEGDVPDIAIKFGTESIVIDSWTRKKQYDAFCAVLGSGVYQHLQVNFSALLIKGLTLK